MMNFIKNLRLEKKLKLGDVAREIGMPLTTYRRFELASTFDDVRLYNAKKICDFYDITIEELLMRKKTQTTQSSEDFK